MRTVCLSLPCDACSYDMQASLRAGKGVVGTLEGWQVEACSTHVAVTCPSTTGPCTSVLVYAFQVRLVLSGLRSSCFDGLLAC